MFNIEYTEDNPQECSLCGDEACFAKECEKENTMSDYTLPHYCRSCHETGEPEVVLEFIDGKEETVYKHCGFCGSSRITPVDDLLDAPTMGEIDDGFSN